MILKSHYFTGHQQIISTCDHNHHHSKVPIHMTLNIKIHFLKTNFLTNYLSQDI